MESEVSGLLWPDAVGHHLRVALHYWRELWRATLSLLRQWARKLESGLDSRGKKAVPAISPGAAISIKTRSGRNPTLDGTALSHTVTLAAPAPKAVGERPQRNAADVSSCSTPHSLL